jgi:hypothetical protein
MPTYTFRNAINRPPAEEPGDYTIKVIGFEFATASTSGNEMLQLKLETENGVLVHDNLVFTEKAWWKIDTALKCLMPSKGLALPNEDDTFDIDDDFATNALLGATGRVSLIKVPVKNKEGSFRNEVTHYLSGEEAAKSLAAPTKKAPAAAATPAKKTAPAEKGPF